MASRKADVKAVMYFSRYAIASLRRHRGLHGSGRSSHAVQVFSQASALKCTEFPCSKVFQVLIIDCGFVGKPTEGCTDELAALAEGHTCGTPERL